FKRVDGFFYYGKVACASHYNTNFFHNDISPNKNIKGHCSRCLNECAQTVGKELSLKVFLLPRGDPLLRQSQKNQITKTV
ncbi:MAG: hypothetical protein J6T42_01495, partial [Clostridia bacterium]|nr:hypothetical protein [Clostridia bacterium]